MSSFNFTDPDFLADSRICILQSTPKTNNEQEGSSSTFRPQQDTAPEPLTVHVSMEQVDRVPSGIQPSAMFGLNKGITIFQVQL